MSKTLLVCPAIGKRVAGTFKDFVYDVRMPYTEVDSEKAFDLIAAGLVALVTHKDGKKIEQIKPEELKSALGKRERPAPVQYFHPKEEATDAQSVEDLKKLLAQQSETIAASQQTIATMQQQISELTNAVKATSAATSEETGNKVSGTSGK